MAKEFKHKIKIYYEDTDSGGIVYYANYLKYLERARTEAISSLGLSNTELFEKYKALIFVKSCDIKYFKPIKLEDEIEVRTKVISTTFTSFTMTQSILKDKEITTQATVRLVSVNHKGKPIKIPTVLKKLIII